MKIYLDDIEIEVETIMMFSKGTIAKPRPEPKPPKDDTPPIRTPKPPQLGVVYKDNLGSLSRNNPSINTFMESGVVYTEGFSIPVDVPLVTFGFVPQGGSLTNFKIWISEKPNGEPLGDRYAEVEKLARRGDALAVSVALEGLGGERRGAIIKKHTPYWLNMTCDDNHPMRWRVSGAFPR
jgi:hypothetical protein